MELPRGSDLTSSNSQRAAPIICDMCFTSTGTALVVTDSLGQLYLYRMSPIADPGGPHVAPYLVTMYEYCLGRSASHMYYTTIKTRDLKSYNSICFNFKFHGLF